ncbi:hypothetical protein TanjilG_10201 [Lupinus angustifolius]|uniref:Uncharacterized protein n=1 Tax=Lupinus angustifolius TaxID=3871 RepID=A0A4P1RBZ8_LUPAN|nr:PREDICTED: uncharacterized protein LOC109353464 [Lupinus angustifolius]OIW07366.1 hypothetical protein TanjilG_10201 [Lupinus angustifolius]
MRCKKHITDLSSSVGVCATCLRQRLTSLLEAQAQAQAQLMRVASRSSDECSRNSSNPPPPIIFPRSVSPYVSSRKSDYDAACDGCDRRERLFFSTPQIGPTSYGGGEAMNGDGNRWKKRLSKFGIFSNLFRSRSEKLRSDSSCEQSSSASPSWFSTVLSNRRKNRDRLGMSPAREDECYQAPSASGCSLESSPRWWRTPSSAAGRNSTRRSRLGLEKSVSDSGMAFCLSPMVRLKQKGMPPEKTAAKPHLSAAASLCANRSRKLADFGKVNHNR